MRDHTLSNPTLSPCNNLGFLSVHQEPIGYVGGYLVTNAWGRPIEFRLSSPVVPNRVQQILYGDTLASYLCGEVIGKTLIEKTTTRVQFVVVDSPNTLEVRHRIDIPVALWQCLVDSEGPGPGLEVLPRVYCHPHFHDDVAVLRDMIEKLHQLDFSEPFTRVREAVAEARKLGVVNRTAAA